MRLQQLELFGFKSFAERTTFPFDVAITAIVGPNGSGKSNTAEAFRWVLGEKSMKSLRGRRGEDLIWNGAGAGRSHRASVRLSFDNHDRRLSVDFDEIVVGREVYRDGTNVYSINGSPVRFRDIVELLGAVSLGASDHFIINQGEADRILTASSQDRRQIIEDALGLGVYKWKIAESEKKLTKTAENIERAESLRRELAPHLRFLKKQMEKIEQADRWRRELKTHYLEYLKIEDHYLRVEKERIKEERRRPTRELADIEERLASAARLDPAAPSPARTKLEEADDELRRLADRRDELTRRLGRLEGQLDAAGRESVGGAAPAIAAAEVDHLTTVLGAAIDEAAGLSDIYSLKSALARIKKLIGAFWESHRGSGPSDTGVTRREGLVKEQAVIEAELEGLRAAAENLMQERVARQRDHELELAARHGAEREVMELKLRQGDLRSRLNMLNAAAEKLVIEEGNFKRELAEAEVLVDREVLNYQREPLAAALDRPAQEERRRLIEKLKIRLEDLGGESGDTVKEFQAVGERDAFLEREIADLLGSEASLRAIIKDLTLKIEHDFKAGLVKINHHFQEFFALMFGGGAASLSLFREKVRRDIDDLNLDDGEVSEEGIEVNINLPRKRVRGLSMLSGGERALVSIALLFAMSQVNPPPFLVLDETDAALDEANSRKYGDMIENLAKHSQLILITHNRETMSHAGVIYGVTMGGDGVSKLLSIKFDEAVNFAKA